MEPVVYCIGETVLDIIFRDGAPVSAIPGGSMLNTSVSLGRAGQRAEFISEYGNDHTGKMIDSFLQENHVGSGFINRYGDGKTTLALAFLDRELNASYTFYTQYPAVRMKGPLPETKKEDVILFGSSYSITPGIHGKIKKWVKKAKAAGTLIIYDPNFRKSHAAVLDKVRPWIIQNIALADIVRGSDEDFLTVFGLEKPEEIKTRLRSSGCNNVIITRNSKSVISWFGDNKTEINIPPVKPLVSTVGAGDNFNAGIIYSLVNSKLTAEDVMSMPKSRIEALILSGIAFSAEVCKSPENYISPGFSKNLKS
jgi:fructokinase